MIESSRFIRIALHGIAVMLACSCLYAESEPARPPEPKGTEAAETETNPLEQAITHMRTAQERIRKNDTGEQTQELQRKVVSDIDKLIELSKQASSNQQQKKAQQQSQQSSNENSQANQQNSQQKQPMPQPNGPDKKDNAADSQARSPEADAREAQILDQRGTAAVWGHLPEKLREELRNVDAGKTLSKYSDLVRRYYQALAEQNTNPRRDERRNREK